MVYRCTRIFNNSVVLARKNTSETEVILIGKGIGANMSKKDSSIIPSDKIEKIYEPQTQEENSYAQSLIEKVPHDLIDITLEVIEKAEKLLNTKFRPNLYLTLLDHLSYSVERIIDDIDSGYPYLEEMKVLLKDEYEVALKLVRYINFRMNISLKDDEAILLAVHFSSARQDKFSFESKNELYENIISDIIEIIKLKAKADFNFDSYFLQRLKTHLRFIINDSANVKNRMDYKGYYKFKNVLLEGYNQELEISQLILEYLNKKYHIKLPEDEIIYLTMHIIPILNK